MDNQILINKSDYNKNSNDFGTNTVSNHIDIFSCENTAIDKSFNKKPTLRKSSDDNKVRTFSSGITCNLRSIKSSTEINFQFNNFEKKNSTGEINNNFKTRSSFAPPHMPNKKQISKMNSIVRKTCLTKFDVIKFESKKKLNFKK